MSLGFVWNGGQVQATINRLIDNRMDAQGKAFVSHARQLAPRRTGQLEESIGYTYDRSRKLLQLHADVPYALFQEYGTRWMMAHPYLRPAINESGRVWGGTVQIQFPNVPHLVGTFKKPNVKAVEFNRATAMKLARGRSGKAEVIARRGKWNGPKGQPWMKTWNAIPGPRPRHE